MSHPRVWWSLDEVPADFGPSALTIGNFDGVHAGHRVLMQRTAHIGRANQWKPSVLTFQPHPAKVVAPDRAPKLITSFERRVEQMGEEGIEQVLVLPFNRQISQWTARQFIEDLVVGRLGAKAVIVGEDFRFGHKQSGDRALLAALGALHGFEEIAVAPVLVRGDRASSSLVRTMAAEGRVPRAARLLTQPFSLQGKVVSGQGIGSRQTVPTLNLEPDSEVLPRHGVYVTRTRSLNDDRAWRSITNIGVRPTFAGEGVTVETFLLDPFSPPVPDRIRVAFLRRIRDERKFDSPELLKAQILRDVARAQRVHDRLRNYCA